MKAKYIKPEMDLHLIKNTMNILQASSVVVDSETTGTEDSHFGSKRRTYSFADDIMGGDDFED